MINDSDGLLILGSSVQVYSAFKYVKLANEDNKKIFAVNIGPTRVDHLINHKIEYTVSDVIKSVCKMLNLENNLNEFIKIKKK